jgi:predicted CXXCH cytochrome family protein
MSFFGTPAAATQEPPPDTSVSAPSRLTIPPQQLCVSCHVQHGDAYARGRGLQQHAPAAAGECTGCHNPHQALRRYMLLGADNRELCAGCHEPTSLSTVHATDPTQDCIECHNAHAGVTGKLLRSDAPELSLLYDGREDE